ncbi:hypothetical protein [Photobacterium kishitanii]|nr:hypothetical protein [Photobacterium kishitanii]
MNTTHELPAFMIHQSFRYVIGRRSYAVTDWVSWAIENWGRVPEQSKRIIMTEVEERLTQVDFCQGTDDDLIVVTNSDSTPFGDDVDLGQWLRLRNLWTKDC